MTSEERDSDIGDYINALDLLVDVILEKFSHTPNIKVLGFSQGAATATRWVCRGRTKVDKLVLWAGSFPPDIDYSGDFEKLKKMDLAVVLGEKDEFFKDSYILDLEKLFGENGVGYQIYKYDGNHDMHMETFKKFIYN